MERTFFQWVLYIFEHYGLWFLKGAGITLLIAIVSTAAGFLLGLLIGTLRTIPVDPARNGKLKYAGFRVMDALLCVYIEIFRGTPMIVQAVVIYFGLQEGLGIDIPPLPAAFLIVSLNTGAYMAEVVRGGIQSIDAGQTEAAQAVGMTHFQTMVSVILPQAIRNILPATGNEFIINIKDTAVLNVISVTELFFMTKSVKGAIFRTYETFLVAGVIYLFLTLTVSRVLRIIERRMDGPRNFTLATSSTMPDNILPAPARNGRGRGGNRR